MLRIFAIWFLLTLQVSSALGQVGPWEVKRPSFGVAAVGSTDIAPNTPKWNILNVGLFCGSRQAKAPRVNLYVYGIEHRRLASNLPVEATFTLDGRATNLVLRPHDDLALGPVDAAFVRSLMAARDATVSIKDYRSPDPERINMDGAAGAIRSALRECFTVK